MTDGSCSGTPAPPEVSTLDVSLQDITPTRTVSLQSPTQEYNSCPAPSLPHNASSRWPSLTDSRPSRMNQVRIRALCSSFSVTNLAQSSILFLFWTIKSSSLQKPPAGPLVSVPGLWRFLPAIDWLRDPPQHLFPLPLGQSPYSSRQFTVKMMWSLTASQTSALGYHPDTPAIPDTHVHTQTLACVCVHLHRLTTRAHLQTCTYT